jgi:hypothetical protein
VSLDVGLIPPAGVWVGQVVRTAVYGTILSTHHTPSTFSLDAAHGCHHAGAQISHPVAMRYLVETIWRLHGPNAYWFEQDVITRIASHCGWFSGSANNLLVLRKGALIPNIICLLIITFD